MIEAVVQAGSFETPYRRTGRGGAVLLLFAEEDQELGDWLLDTLGERFRTIAPDLPSALRATPTLIGEWLPALIDGLGLDQPAVVAGVAHAHALLSFAARDHDRAGRLVLIQGNTDGTTADTAAALAAAAGVDTHRVVMVPRPEDLDGRSAALATVLDLLAVPG